MERILNITLIIYKKVYKIDILPELPIFDQIKNYIKTNVVRVDDIQIFHKCSIITDKMLISDIPKEYIFHSFVNQEVDEDQKVQRFIYLRNICKSKF